MQGGGSALSWFPVVGLSLPDSPSFSPLLQPYSAERTPPLTGIGTYLLSQSSCGSAKKTQNHLQLTSTHPSPSPLSEGVEFLNNPTESSLRTTGVMQFLQLDTVQGLQEVNHRGSDRGGTSPAISFSRWGRWYILPLCLFPFDRFYR